MNIGVATNYCETHLCEDCIVKSLFSKEMLDAYSCFELLASIDRVFNIKYIVDDGERWERRNCFIKAIDAATALNIFHKDIESKLAADAFIIDGYTKVYECNSPVILDIDTIEDESKLYYV